MPLLVWFSKQGNETLAVHIFLWGQTGKLDERGIDVNQPNRPVAATAGTGHAGGNDDERYAVGLLPQGKLHARFLVAEVVAVVSPQYDYGVIRLSCFIKLVEQASYHLVGEVRRCLVALYHLLETAGSILGILYDF